jgi:hypothetical protein
VDASPTRELSSNIRPRVAFLPRRLPSPCPLRPLPAPAGLRQSRKGNSREGNAEGNSVQSIFLKETRGKETSVCPGGGQQVAENGGNERAVPMLSQNPTTPVSAYRLDRRPPRCVTPYPAFGQPGIAPKPQKQIPEPPPTAPQTPLRCTHDAPTPGVPRHLQPICPCCRVTVVGAALRRLRSQIVPWERVFLWCIALRS